MARVLRCDRFVEGEICRRRHDWLPRRIRPCTELLEDRRLLSGTWSWRISGNGGQLGLAGSYVNQNLCNRNEQDDWRVTQPIAGHEST